MRETFDKRKSQYLTITFWQLADEFKQFLIVQVCIRRRRRIDKYGILFFDRGNRQDMHLISLLNPKSVIRTI
jgi:hypothetical protein